MRATRLLLKLATCAALATVLVAALAGRRDGWTPKERVTRRSLSVASLGPLPADRSNRAADDARAAAVGERLFSDTLLSGNGNADIEANVWKYSLATRQPLDV